MVGVEIGVPLLAVTLGAFAVLVLLPILIFFIERHRRLVDSQKYWLAGIAQRLNDVGFEMKIGNFAYASERLSHLLNELDIEKHPDMVALREQFNEYDRLRVQQVEDCFIKLNDFFNKTYFKLGGLKK